MQQQWSPFLIEISSPVYSRQMQNWIPWQSEAIKRFVNDSSGYFSTLTLLNSVVIVTFIALYADRCIANTNMQIYKCWTPLEK